MTPPNPPSGDHQSLEELVAMLHRAIFMRESQQAARAYEEIVGRKKDFALAVGLQFDLARLLELGNEPRMALVAYERILTAYAEESCFAASLRGAGHLAYRLKSFKKCRAYLEKFLQTNPSNAERVDAENLLTRLPDGKGVPERRLWQNVEDSFAPGAHETPLPLPKAGRLVPDEYKEEDPKAGGTGSPISLQDVYSDSDANLPPTNEIDPHVLPQPPSSDAFFSAPTPIEQPAPTPGPSGDNLPPVPPATKGDLPPTADMPAPAEPQGPPSADLIDYDRFSETPPLRISSRDIGERLKTPIPPPAAEPPPARPVVVAAVVPSKGPPPDPPSDIGQWADVVPARTPEEADRERKARRVAAEIPAQTPEFLATCEAYLRSTFAVLLPISEDIRVDSVIRVLRRTEPLGEEEAREAIVQRKGLLRENLTFEETVDFYQKARRSSQKLTYIRVEPGHLPDTRHDALKVDVMDPGLRIKTVRGVRKTRWEHIRLISCARLDRQPTVDLFCKESCEHLRLRHPAVDFHALVERPGEDESQSCKQFLVMLADLCPGAMLSHTVRNLLSGKTYRPQKFASEDEFRRYNMCLLLTHFGIEVDPRELLEVSRAVSASGTAH
jgi:hypothetical protein